MSFLCSLKKSSAELKKILANGQVRQHSKWSVSPDDSPVFISTNLINRAHEFLLVINELHGLIWLAEQFVVRFSNCANGFHSQQIEVPRTHPAAFSAEKNLINSEQVCQPMCAWNDLVSCRNCFFHYLWREKEKSQLSDLSSFICCATNTGILGEHSNSEPWTFEIPGCWQPFGSA